MGNLSNAMSCLADDVVSTYNDRMAFIRDLRRNTGELLNRCHDDHGKMSEDQNRSLSNFAKNLSGSTGSFLKDFRKTYGKMAKDQRDSLSESRNKRSTDVTKMLEKFHSDRQKMGKELRKDLKSFSIELSEVVGELGKAVGIMRKEMQDDIAGASEAWRKRSYAMVTKRKGVNSNVEQKVEPKVEPAVEAASPKPVSIKQQETPMERIRERFRSKKSG